MVEGPLRLVCRWRPVLKRGKNTEIVAPVVPVQGTELSEMFGMVEGAGDGGCMVGGGLLGLAGRLVLVKSTVERRVGLVGVAVLAILIAEVGPVFGSSLAVGTDLTVGLVVRFSEMELLELIVL